MKTDIILSGVGGQGILSIATIIGEAATRSGLKLKQAEVHGMSQRGGDVQSNLRLSDKPISSDLIPLGGVEALRYLPFLSKDGWIITSSTPFKNIPNYPEVESVMAELNSLPNVISLDIDAIAKENNMPKCGNVILLGAAAAFFTILEKETLYHSIERIFGSKGEAVVEMNHRAFNIGYEYSLKRIS